MQASFGNGVLSNVLGASRDGRVPTVYSFSLGVQQEIAGGTTLDIAYCGDTVASFGNIARYQCRALWHGVPKELRRIRIAWITVTQLNPCSREASYLMSSRDYNRNMLRPGLTSTASVPLDTIILRQILPSSNLSKVTGKFRSLNSIGTSNYNFRSGLVATPLQQRPDFRSGLHLVEVAGYSKLRSRYARHVAFRRSDEGAASWDRTHVFAANYVYDLPNVTKHFGGPKWLSYVTDNYQLSGIVQAMTGTPIDLNNGFSFPPGSVTGSDQYGALPFYYSLDRNGNPLLPTIGVPNAGSRDRLRGGGMQDWDMSLFKNIPLGKREGRYLQTPA